MTMTRDKIEELKRLYAAMTNCEMYGEDGAAKGVMVPQSLLDQFERALAERALEPELHVSSECVECLQKSVEALEAKLEPQGQALPKLPDPVDEVLCYDQHSNGVAGGLITTSLPAADDYFTADQMVARYNNGCVAGYASGFAAGRASQLALPAGPVPEGVQALIGTTEKAIADAKRILGDEYPNHMACRDAAVKAIGSLQAIVALLKSGRVFSSPAVAQPVAAVDQHHFVQPVPDHCDRITWRNRHYHLPLNDGEQPVADEREGIKFCQYEAFTEATRQVKAVSDDLQASFARDRAALCQPAEEGDHGG